MRSGDLIWWNGALVPWDSARIHVTSETALRGLNVFEGLRAYWRPGEASFAVVGLSAHLARLQESARLLSMPATDVVCRFKDAITQVIQAVQKPDDLYLRPTIYVDQGGYQIEPARVVLGEFVSWRPEASRVHRTLRCCVSSWTRLPSRSLPSSAKIGATYTAFRMARIEALSKGCEEAILLNTHGRVCETAGASVFVVSGSKLTTPSLEEDILPSITRQIVMHSICSHLNLQIEQRPLCVEDLFAADEVFVAGTLDEISRVTEIDGSTLPCRDDSRSVTARIQTLFKELTAGSQLRDSGWIDLVPSGENHQ